MFDARLRPLIDPPLARMGAVLASRGVSADQVTVAGFLIGLAGGAAIAIGWPGIGLVLLLLNRIADGLDGAVARIAGKTDRGGYLDITLDFAIYGIIPLAFAAADPSANALPAAALIASFYMNGAAFLAFAVMAEKRGLKTSAQGTKSLYYVAGIAEGAETIAVFAAMCLFPNRFPEIAAIFAAITAFSAVARIVGGASVLR